MKKLVLPVALACLAAFTAAASADGIMNAIAYEPLPAGSAIMVRPLDNSDNNMALKADFERVLKQKGYAVSNDAKLILTFETIDLAGSWTGGGPNPFVELSNNPDQSGVEAPRVHFNLFNSERGGILNPDKTERTRMVTPSTFRIEATIDSKADGKRLWQGWSAIPVGPGDSHERTRTMVPVMVEGIGKTVREQPFPTSQ